MENLHVLLRQRIENEDDLRRPVPPRQQHNDKNNSTLALILALLGGPISF